jgi:type II secretory pathway pseudopilin PulG
MNQAPLASRQSLRNQNIHASLADYFLWLRYSVHRFDPRTVQPVVSRYTDWATWPTLLQCAFSNSHDNTKKVPTYVYNKQLDALFILSLLNRRTSTCFGSTNGPTSEGTLCVCGNWHYTCKLTVSGPGWKGTSRWRQLRSIVPIAIYTHYTSWWWAVETPETCRGASVQ